MSIEMCLNQVSIKPGEVQLDPIPYIVKRTSRKRSVGIVVMPDRRVVFRVPRRFSGDLEPLLKKYEAWILRRQAYFTAHPPANRVLPKLTVDEINRHRIQALKKIEESISRFQSFMGLQPKKISIRNQKSRWGSCNRNRHLNFNWRLVLLPQELLDYVVVHEMCHMIHLNHSRVFWKKVAVILPDYWERRRRLKSFVLTAMAKAGPDSRLG